MNYELLFVLLGAVSMILTYYFLEKMIKSASLTKKNYASRDIATLGGLVLAVAYLVMSSILIFFQTNTRGGVSMSLIVLVLGFGFIGLIDDLAGDQSRQGFKGHISELLKGNITTGSIKLFGGPIIAVIALADQIPSSGYLRFIGQVIALSLIANVFNLLDLTPGRTTKYALITIAISIVLYKYNMSYSALFLGVLFVSLIFDLREQYMLGDIGSNIIGAVVGYLLVCIPSKLVLIIVLFVAVFLNVLSEFISFSKIIEKCRVLRFFDELGQTKQRKEFIANKRKKI